MTLYSDVMEPASHAVRFVLAEKAINVDIVTLIHFCNNYHDYHDKE